MCKQVRTTRFNTIYALKSNEGKHVYHYCLYIIWKIQRHDLYRKEGLLSNQHLHKEYKGLPGLCQW